MMTYRCIFLTADMQRLRNTALSCLSLICVSMKMHYLHRLLFSLQYHVMYDCETIKLKEFKKKWVSEKGSELLLFT